MTLIMHDGDRQLDSIRKIICHTLYLVTHPAHVHWTVPNYIGKTARSQENELPKKFLGAWMH